MDIFQQLANVASNPGSFVCACFRQRSVFYLLARDFLRSLFCRVCVCVCVLLAPSRRRRTSPAPASKVMIGSVYFQCDFCFCLNFYRHLVWLLRTGKRCRLGSEVSKCSSSLFQKHKRVSLFSVQLLGVDEPFVGAQRAAAAAAATYDRIRLHNVYHTITIALIIPLLTDCCVVSKCTHEQRRTARTRRNFAIAPPTPIQTTTTTTTTTTNKPMSITANRTENPTSPTMMPTLRVEEQLVLK
jgi:hypothetical protein